MKLSYRQVPLVALGVVLLALAFGCTAPPARIAFNAISDAHGAVVRAATAYKRNCGVPVGGDGPGTCDAVKYAKAEAAFSEFLKTELDAVDIASHEGSTPLEVVSAAAASALRTIAALKGGQ